ncbi:MAG: PAS domain S-box protein [Chitinispirillia bacterium]|jgi:PAS domain S-box-containing protein
MNKKILIVDDNDEYLFLLKNLIETFENDIDTIMAGNGADALRKIETELPDAVILDIQIPIIDGYEVCRRVRKNPDIPFIPIILVTGQYLSTENRIDGYNAGCDDYLSKPFNKSELFARLSSVLRIKELHEQLKNERDNLEITVKKRTRELEESQKILMEYKNVVEGSEDMIMALDKEYKFVLINDSFLKCASRLRENTIGYSVSHVLGEEAFWILKPQIDKCFQDNIVEFEFQYSFPEKGRKDLNVIYYPLKNKNGKITEITSILRDITERKKVEEGLREAYKIINMGPAVAFLWRNRDNLPVSFVSDNVKSLFGYTAKEFISGKVSYGSIIHPDDFERVFQKMKKISSLSGRKKITNEPYRIITKEGKTRWIDARIFIRKDSNDNITHYQGVVIDLTELKELEAQKQIHQQQLIQADKMASLGILVSGVAHEINNPTNFIRLNVDVLSDIINEILPILDEYSRIHGDFILTGLPYSEMRKKLVEVPKSITLGVDRIIKIIQDLKGFARMDSGEMVEGININSVLESSIEMMSHLIKKSTRHFSVEYCNDIPEIRGNFYKLEQVFMNLLINSCQSLKNNAEGINVKVQYLKDSNSINVILTDDGIGISKKDINHILDPFFTTKRDSGGTGLGLSVSYSILQEHNATIEFKSKKNYGTEVSINIPVT